MNKHYRMIFSIAAVAVIAGTLFGSTFSQTQETTTTLSLPQTEDDLVQKIRDMGGLQLVMPQAFAETDCGVLEASGRTVHEFNLTGDSIENIPNSVTYQVTFRQFSLAKITFT